MVREANEKAFYSEKALTESNMKVGKIGAYLLVVLPLSPRINPPFPHPQK